MHAVKKRSVSPKNRPAALVVLARHTVLAVALAVAVRAAALAAVLVVVAVPGPAGSANSSNISGITSEASVVIRVVFK